MPLRNAQIADLPCIVEIYNAVIPGRQGAADTTPVTVASRESWFREFDSEGPTPIAFALFFHNFSTFLGRKGLYLEDLFVQPAFRRRGYGRALLVHLARIAVARDCGRFEWAVLDWNAPAIGFYKSLGATVMPDWRISRVTGPALEKLAAQPLFGAR